MSEVIKQISNYGFLFYNPLFIGPLIGFSAFLIGVITMEGIIIRKDDNNKIKLRLDNLISYMKFPFSPKQYKLAWGLIPDLSLYTRLKLWNLNWVIMVGCGTFLSITYYQLNKKI